MGFQSVGLIGSPGRFPPAQFWNVVVLYGAWGVFGAPLSSLLKYLNDGSEYPTQREFRNG